MPVACTAQVSSLRFPAQPRGVSTCSEYERSGLGCQANRILTLSDVFAGVMPWRFAMYSCFAAGSRAVFEAGSASAHYM